MKKIGRTLAVCLTASVLAAASAVPASAAAFRDVSGHWAEATINRWVSLGYINGYPDGTFRPKEPISRTEFAVVANHAFQFQNTQAIYFPDVAQSFWGYGEIQKAYAAGYMKGDADGTFRPRASVTRQEAAVMLANIKGLTLGGSAPYYSDNASISSWARGSVNAVSAAGYMSGYPDGSFRPKERISRAEVVTMLNKALGTTGGNTNTNTVTPPSQTTNTAQNMTLKETTLRNTVISGDLTIPSSMSSRNITLDNVTVKGKLTVEGGGTITAKDCDVNELSMDKSSAVFRAEDGTSVVKTTFRSNGTLEGEGFRNVEVSNSRVDTVTIDAEVDELTLDTDADTRLYGGADIDTFEITKNADEALIELSKGARVRNMNIRSDVRIAGKGDIDNMTVYVSGVRSEIEPDDLSRKSGAGRPDFDYEYTGKRHEGSSGSSSGSSSSSGSNKTISDDFNGNDKEYRNVTITDEAKVSDMTITGDLTISKDVGNDEVELVDLDVRGDVYVYGGGDDSVIFRNCTIRGNIISDKDSSGSGKRVVALKFDDKTEVRGEIRILDHTTLAPYRNSSPKLDDVVVETKNVDLYIEVDINRLKLEKAADIELDSGVTIDRLETDRGIDKTDIEMNGSSRIKNIDAKSDIDIKGTGTVNKITEGSGADVTYGAGITVDPDGTATEVKVTGVTVTPTEAIIAVGGKATLSASIAPANATNKNVTWTTSDEKVATVTNGIVTGVKAGKATITVTTADGGKTATCAVEVKETVTPPEPVTEMTILPKTVTLEIGDAPLELSVVSNEEADTKSVNWTINGDAAAVEAALKVITLAQEQGKDTATVTPVGIGSATVKATAGNGKSTTRTITVKAAEPVVPGKDVPVTAVRIVPSTLELQVGDGLKQLDAVLTPSNATNKSVTWTVNDSSIVEVNKGQTELQRTYAQAKSIGTAKITVTALGTEEGAEPVTNTCDVTVSPKITVTPEGGATAEKGKAKVFKVAAEGCAGFEIIGIVKNAEGTDTGWTITPTNPAQDANEGTIAVTPDAGAENGEYTLKVSIKSGEITYPADAVKFEVVDEIIAATNVELPQTPTTVKVGETKKIDRTVTPPNATSGITWASKDGTIATVDQNGNVTGRKAGSTLITAAFVKKDGTRDSDSCTVQVIEPMDTVTIRQNQTLEMGTNKTLEFQCTPSTATERAVTWESQNQDILTVVSDTGVATPVKLGTATVKVKANVSNAQGQTAEDVERVTVNPGLKLKQGDTEVTEVTVKTGQSVDIGYEVNLGEKPTAAITTGNAGLTAAVDKDNLKITVTALANAAAGDRTLTVTTEGTVSGTTYRTTKTVKVKVEAYAPGITISNKTPVVSIVQGSSHDFAYTLKDMENPTISAKVKQNTVEASDFTPGTGTAGTVRVTAERNVTPGKYTLEVTATKDSETRTDSVDFTVTELVESVSLDKTPVTIVRGNSHNFGYTLENMDRVMPTATVTKKDGSKPGDVRATVDTNTKAVAVTTAAGADPGVYTLTVSAASTGGTEKTDNVDFTVTAPVTGVVLNQTAVTIKAGETVELTAEVQPNEASDKTVSWESNNKAVATVSDNGTVTGVKKGTATITVTTADGNHEETCAVTVEDAPTVEVNDVPVNTSIQENTEQELVFKYAVKGFTSPTPSVMVRDSSDRPVSGSFDAKAEIANNICTATVKVKTDTPIGTYKLIVSVRETGKDIEISSKPESFSVVKAAEIAVTGVTVSPPNAEMAVNETKTLTATVTPQNATNKSVEWGSNKDSVATVDGSGQVTAKGQGTATITATAAGGKIGTCTITVKPAASTPPQNTASQPAAASAEPSAAQQEAPRRMSSLFLQREAKNTVELPDVTAEPEKTEMPITVKEPEKTAEPEKAEAPTTPEKTEKPAETPEKAETPTTPTTPVTTPTAPATPTTPVTAPTTPTTPATPTTPEQKTEGVTLTCAASFKAGETLALSGTTPGVMKTIEWSIKDAGATGAAIQNGTLSAQQAGTITIAATVQNGATTYFTITVLPGTAAPEAAEPAATPNVPVTSQTTTPAAQTAAAQTGTANAQTGTATVQTAVLANGQVVSNVKKFQRSVGTNVALNSLGVFPAEESAVWSMERVGVSGATLYNNTLMNVNSKGVILLGRTVRGADGVLATTYYEITFI